MHDDIDRNIDEELFLVGSWQLFVGRIETKKATSNSPLAYFQD